MKRLAVAAFFLWAVLARPALCETPLLVVPHAGVDVASAVERLANLDAAIEQLGAGGLDVGDDQV